MKSEKKERVQLLPAKILSWTVAIVVVVHCGVCQPQERESSESLYIEIIRRSDLSTLIRCLIDDNNNRKFVRASCSNISWTVMGVSDKDLIKDPLMECTAVLEIKRTAENRTAEVQCSMVAIVLTTPYNLFSPVHLIIIEGLRTATTSSPEEDTTVHPNESSETTDLPSMTEDAMTTSRSSTNNRSSTNSSSRSTQIVLGLSIGVTVIIIIIIIVGLSLSIPCMVCWINRRIGSINMAESNNRSAIKLLQSPVEPVERSTVEPVMEPVLKPVVEPVIEAVVEPVVEPVVELVVEPVEQPPVEAVMESVVEQVVEPVVEPVEETVVKQAEQQSVEQVKQKPKQANQRQCPTYCTSRGFHVNEDIGIKRGSSTSLPASVAHDEKASSASNTLPMCSHDEPVVVSVSQPFDDQSLKAFTATITGSLSS